MTHGYSPFDVTRRNLTPLDIVTAHSILPGRDDVALLLEEAMRGNGWTGGRMEQKRRLHEQRMKKKGKQKEIREEACKVLGVNSNLWASDTESASDSDLDDNDLDEDVYVSIFVYHALDSLSIIFRHPFQITLPCWFFHLLYFLKSLTPSSQTFRRHYKTPLLQTHYTC
jgi:hypothetical protein